MKRLILAAFLAGLLGIGCMENHLVPGNGAPAAAKAPPRPVPPPVTPDQVNPDNAVEMTKRLEDELNSATPQPEIPPNRKDSK